MTTARPLVLALAALLIEIPALAAPPPQGLPRLRTGPPVDPGEWGDAPEGRAAYPWLGVAGTFPTCFGGPASYVRHANQVPVLFWGRGMDTEFDGNAGMCLGAAYEEDECYDPHDGDAGLMIPDGFTLDPTFTQAITCSGFPGRTLGSACTTTYWGLKGGGNLDLVLTNLTGQPAWVNVLMDWNQDGQWDGTPTFCGPQPNSEWVIQNLPVPAHFTGFLSALSPPPLFIGPNPGYVWCRFTVHDGAPLSLVGWDGSSSMRPGGSFDSGETEDYLLKIDPPIGPGDMGDAPEGVLAYPPDGTIGRFPTCLNGPAGFVFHDPGGLTYLGPLVDYETDGNHNLCSFQTYDNDECGGTPLGDAGLLRPGAWTIDASNSYVPCVSGASPSLGRSCDAVQWGTALDVQAVNNLPAAAYLHVLADWDHDGTWVGGTTTTCSQTGGTYIEQAMLNFPIPSGFSGPVSSLAPPGFTLGPAGYAWFRFSITPEQVNPDWNGSGHFSDGETEDYLLHIDPATADVNAPLPFERFAIERAEPNPFGRSTTVVFSLREAGPVRLRVVDLAGRNVATLVDAVRGAGRHTATWNGRHDDGRPASPGIYFVRGEAAGFTRSFKLTRLN